LEQEQDLPVTWYDVLLHLDEVPRRRMRMNELAGAVVVSKSGLTTLVDRMQEAGLVAREPDDNDRRAIDVVLTKAGKARFDKARQLHRRGIRRHFSDHLTEADAKRLIAILEKLQGARAR
jgi:DNA-binding MarR family transcriptional regulator